MIRRIHFLALALVSLGVGARALGASEIHLQLVKGPGAGQVTLSWSGGIPAYAVHRSNAAATVSSPGSVIGQTSTSSWVEGPAPSPPVFYTIVSVGCSVPGDCASGFCVDGACCASACTGTCQACNVPGSEGSCVAVPLGQDPADECPGPAACNGAGACANPNATPCSAPSQCLSGFCVDACCCNSACTGTCQACDVSGSLGTCSFIPTGQDPANECAGTSVCNGAGGCTP